MSEQTEIRYDTGFGLIHRNIMRDKNLSIEAKAIYSYISSFAGVGMVAYPGIELMCSELNISEKRFHKYKNELINIGYLTIERERQEKGFSKNIYTLHVQPVTGQIVPLQNVTLQNVTLQNDSTNNNSLNNNNNNNITTTGNPKLIELVEFYEKNNFGIMTPYKQEILLHWVDELNEQQQGYDLVIAALKMAVKAEALTLNYIESILRTWHNSRIFNIHEARAHEMKRKNKNTSKAKKPLEAKIEQNTGIDENGKRKRRDPYDPEATYYDIYTDKELKEIAEQEGLTVEEISNIKVYK